MGKTVTLSPVQRATSGIVFLMYQLRRRHQLADLMSPYDVLAMLEARQKRLHVLDEHNHPLAVILDCTYDTACASIQLEPHGERAKLMGFWPVDEPSPRAFLATTKRMLRLQSDFDGFLKQRAEELNAAWLHVIGETIKVRDDRLMPRAQRA
jgi:hypothetical protein